MILERGNVQVFEKKQKVKLILACSQDLDNDVILNLLLNLAVFTHLVVMVIGLLKLFHFTKHKIVAKRILIILDIIDFPNFQ